MSYRTLIQDTSSYIQKVTPTPVMLYYHKSVDLGLCVKDFHIGVTQSLLWNYTYPQMVDLLTLQVFCLHSLLFMELPEVLPNLVGQSFTTAHSCVYYFTHYSSFWLPYRVYSQSNLVPYSVLGRITILSYFLLHDLH